MSINFSTPMQQLKSIIDHARNQGLVQQVDESASNSGRTVRLNGRDLINFGSCGYMGLEFDQRLKEGAIDAINRFGIEMSCSRSFLANPLYPELEDLFARIFGLPALLYPTTTLAHLGALPVLIDERDVVLVDQQVHSSVHLTTKVLKAAGAQVELVSHNNLARIERKINAYKDTKRHIWYLGDGVYSMNGDLAPVEELRSLLDRYEQFWIYLDDAHGMSWIGMNGKGYVLDKLASHERMFVAFGLAKGFGTGGGGVICPSLELKQFVRTCSGTQIFSAPLQPPILGAAVASARIHLSGEFPGMQREIRERIEYSAQLLAGQPLPLIAAKEGPIRFLGVGSLESAQKIVKLLIEDGFWLNIAGYPAVAPHHAGLRFMVNRNLSLEDIEKFVFAIKKAVSSVIGDDEEALSQVWKAFSKDYRYSLING